MTVTKKGFLTAAPLAGLALGATAAIASASVWISELDTTR
jgi:hypothetical protein